MGQVTSTYVFAGLLFAWTPPFVSRAMLDPVVGPVRVDYVQKADLKTAYNRQAAAAEAMVDIPFGMD
jgi:hypothetical protein